MNKSSVSCLARGFFLPIFDEKALPRQARQGLKFMLRWRCA